MAHRRRAAGLLLWLLLLPLAGCGGSGGNPALAAPPSEPAPEPPPTRRPPPVPNLTPPPVFGYEVVREYPHDPQAFTQGLFFHDGFLYESTGLRGESTLRRGELESGGGLEERRLLPQFFGEGATLAGDFIYQLTWESGIGFVYTRDGFRLVREFRYPGEGWGLTFDGEHLVMSDGSDSLRFLDPNTLRQMRKLNVTVQGERLPQLNELEWIDGEIWANIWTQDRIARIDPDTGEVTAFVDLTGILPRSFALRYPEMDVLNGIAWDPGGGRIFVTGKKWPKLFEIELVETQE
ncbi:MAG: glutaminyl-peptide cyclotransferase [Acidobacteria bacterium]|nr:glutaminyl-peptide cyclotransferase [Acidobacteriota bacterium]